MDKTDLLDERRFAAALIAIGLELRHTTASPIALDNTLVELGRQRGLPMKPGDQRRDPIGAAIIAIAAHDPADDATTVRARACDAWQHYLNVLWCEHALTINAHEIVI